MVKKTATLIATLLVTGLVVGYAFWDVDFAELGALLAKGAYWVLAPFLLLLAFYFWFTALRWTLILRPLGRYSVAQVFPAMMMGFGGNNLLPAHMGELVRAIVFARQTSQSRSGILITQVLERVLDIFTILSLYFIAVFTLDAYPESLQEGLIGSGLGFGLICLGILLFLRFPTAFNRWWRRLSRPLPAKMGDWGSRILTSAEKGLSALRSPTTLLPLAALSFLKWGAMGGMVWISLYGFGVVIAPGTSVFVLAASALAVTLPSVPGFFGVVQAAFVFALTPFGVSQEAALAASVFFLLAQWFPVTLVGLIYFFRDGMDVTRLRREMAEENDYAG